MASRALPGKATSLPQWLADRMERAGYAVGAPMVPQRQPLRRPSGSAPPSHRRHQEGRHAARGPSPVGRAAPEASGAMPVPWRAWPRSTRPAPARGPHRRGRPLGSSRPRRLRRAVALRVRDHPGCPAHGAPRAGLRIRTRAELRHDGRRGPQLAAQAVALDAHRVAANRPLRRRRRALRRDVAGRAGARKPIRPAAQAGHRTDAARRQHPRPGQLQRASSNPSQVSSRHLGPRGGTVAGIPGLVSLQHRKVARLPPGRQFCVPACSSSRS